MIITLVLIFGVSTSAFAADVQHGGEIFTANCSACHAGGQNAILPERTLQKDVLEKFSMKSIDAIVKQVTEGKNSMPPFGGRLSDQDIQDVANYVLSQAEAGW
uniref:cytochrome c553 n=1 Tax=Goniotrichopsis reniformis TaxID=468933 RepID=UPI001FCCF1F4|nr:cytochrome c553 [Goniotrichopsis reniformis]UNJ14741.1 cytochrome c553 [Goniotrichopsis reniformis]